MSLDDLDDENPLKDELIELKNSAIFKSKFKAVSNCEFWASLLDAFPSLAKEAVKFVLPFVTTYLCEAGFSAMVAMKTKWRARLDIASDMRLALSKKQPRIKMLSDEAQEQTSH